MTDKNNHAVGKRLYIRTFGCQMNVRDSEVVSGLLKAGGYALVDDAKDADVVLFNTCSVRDHAEQRVWSGVGLLSRKKKRPLIGIIGCMAQNYKEEVRRRVPEVDIVVGPSEIDNIALYLEEALRGKSVVAVEERVRKAAIYHTGFHDSKENAYVVISEGCDNYCTYCVVPYTRGRLRHREPGDILDEVKATVASGVRNITLLGQNVNSYESVTRSQSHKVTKSQGHKVTRKIEFVDLLRQVSEVEGLKSLSFVTSHPKDTKTDLFTLMAERPVIRKYLHLPVQSGSDRILVAMGRGYTVAHYEDIVEAFRKTVYNGQLSTDVIVGFPGETDADFEATRQLMERVRFDTAYLFKYSPRPRTKAASGPDDVSRQVKEERHAVLLELQRSISRGKKGSSRL